MIQVIDGKRYNTETAIRIAYSQHANGSVNLYKTIRKNFFLAYMMIENKELDLIEPISFKQAMFYYHQLNLHLVAIAETFGFEPEDA